MATSVSSVTSHFPDAENGFSTTTSGQASAGATTVGLNSVAGYTNGEPVVFIIDPSNSKKQTFTGIMDTAGSQVTGVVWTAGTNVAHDVGATVVDYATATHVAMISKGIKVEHNQDGTHDEALITSRTEDTAPATGDYVLTSDVSASNALKKVTLTNLGSNGTWMTTGGLTDEGVTSRKLAPTVIIETCTGNVTINAGTDIDITGCTTTFTPAVASTALVVGTFTWNNPSTTSTEFKGMLDVDGANETSASYIPVPAGYTKWTTSQVWLVNLTAASHTLKLQATRTVGTGSNSITIMADDTRLTVFLLGDANVTVS